MLPLSTPLSYLHRKRQLYKTKYTPAVTWYFTTLQHYVEQDYKKHIYIPRRCKHTICRAVLYFPAVLQFHGTRLHATSPMPTGKVRPSVSRLPWNSCSSAASPADVHRTWPNTAPFGARRILNENRNHSTEYVQFCHYELQPSQSRNMEIASRNLFTP